MIGNGRVATTCDGIHMYDIFVALQCWSYRVVGKQQQREMWATKQIEESAPLSIRGEDEGRIGCAIACTHTNRVTEIGGQWTPTIADVKLREITFSAQRDVGKIL